MYKEDISIHYEGIKDVYREMRKKPLHVRACRTDDMSTPLVNDHTTNVKIVHCIRHGQGFHNLLAEIFYSHGRRWKQFSHSSDNPYVIPEILDPPLTQTGRDQARALCPRIKTLPIEHIPDLVVLSPNYRALQTGIIVCEHLLGSDKNIPFVAHEMLREETGVHICDKRRPKSQQEREFPFVNFEMVDSEEDEIYRHDRRENKMEVGERIYKFMLWLEKRPEKAVTIVSHSCLFLILFNGICESDETLKKWFQTGEMRTVKLIFTNKFIEH